MSETGARAWLQPRDDEAQKDDGREMACAPHPGRDCEFRTIPLRRKQGSPYQSYFTPNRAMRGPMIVDGSMNADPPPHVMLEAASELPML